MKIYTYKNSTQLRNCDFWKEIEGVPHFCASEVLVTGIKKFYGKDVFNCVDTIDNLVKILFSDWMNSVKDVDRYREIVEKINLIESDKEDVIENNIIEALKKNKRNILESVKFIFEVEDLILEEGYSQEILDKVCSNGEYIQEVFKEKILKSILRDILTMKNQYWIPDWSKNNWIENEFIDVVRKCNILEVEKCMTRLGSNTGELRKDFDSLFNEFNRFSPRKEMLEKLKITEAEILEKIEYSKIEIEFLNDIIMKTEKRERIEKVIIHGLYRLKPIYLRLIYELEKSGIEVIMLNCYNEDFPKTYSLWDELYRDLSESFNIEIIHDDNDGVEHRLVGKYFGDLIEGREEKKISEFYKSEIDLDNIKPSKINGIFEEKEKMEIKDLIDKLNIYEKSSDRDIIFEELWKNTKVIAGYENKMEFIDYVSEVFEETKSPDKNRRSIGRMKEQFYGVKGTEMNRIFKIFYPEEFGVKPFLSYPIGQYILAIYNMWDINKSELSLNHKDLVECLNISSRENETAIISYEKVKKYIGLEKVSRGMTVEDFIEKLENLNEVKKLAKRQTVENEFEMLTHIKISTENIEYLKRIIKDIQRVANKIFENKEKNTKTHFADMIKIIRDEQEWIATSSEEKSLIKEIDRKLNEISSEEEETEIEVIKDTLAFYLSEKEGEDINWLVRDLDQLEGDILAEYSNKEYRSEKIYHYGMLSNENMLERDSLNIPWPLNEKSFSKKEFIRILENISKNSIKYKRCLLFQGIYYLPNRAEVKLKLSYIESDKDKIYTRYFLLDEVLENFQYIRKIDRSSIKLNKDNTRLTKKWELNKEWSDNEKKIIASCPEKFMYICVVNDEESTYKDNIQVAIYTAKLTEFLIKEIWRRNYKNDIEEIKNKNKECEKKVENLLRDLLGAYFTNVEIEKIVSNGFQKLEEYGFDEIRERRIYEEVIKRICKEKCKGDIEKIKEVKNICKANAKQELEKSTGRMNEKLIEIILKRIEKDGFEGWKNVRSTIADARLIRCGTNKVKESEFYKTNKGEGIQILNRLDNMEYSEWKTTKRYIEGFLEEKNDGLYFSKCGQKLKYKISKEICKYCSVKEVCLYSYRNQSINILENE